MHRLKLLLTTAVALVAFGAATAEAPAAEWSIANGGAVNAVSSGNAPAANSAPS